MGRKVVQLITKRAHSGGRSSWLTSKKASKRLIALFAKDVTPQAIVRRHELDEIVIAQGLTTYTFKPFGSRGAERFSELYDLLGDILLLRSDGQSDVLQTQG